MNMNVGKVTSMTQANLGRDVEGSGASVVNDGGDKIVTQRLRKRRFHFFRF